MFYIRGTTPIITALQKLQSLKNRLFTKIQNVNIRNEAFLNPCLYKVFVIISLLEYVLEFMISNNKTPIITSCKT